MLWMVVFRSRNKDNTNIQGFNERKQSFLVELPWMPRIGYLSDKFNKFISEGKQGEVSRCYVSVNPRSAEKTKKALMHYLIDNEVNLCKMRGVVNSLANKDENRDKSLGDTWLLDLDDITSEEFFEIEAAIDEAIKKAYENKKNSTKRFERVGWVETPNGVHCLCKPFNPNVLNDLEEKHRSKITLIKDGLLLLDSEVKL